LNDLNIEEAPEIVNEEEKISHINKVKDELVEN